MRVNLDTVALATTVEVEKDVIFGYCIMRINMTGPEATLPTARVL